MDIIRWGVYNIDRGKKHKSRYPFRLFLKTLFYADLSEDKESYLARRRENIRIIKNAMGGIKEQIKRGQKKLPSCDGGLL